MRRRAAFTRAARRWTPAGKLCERSARADGALGPYEQPTEHLGAALCTAGMMPAPSQQGAAAAALAAPPPVLTAAVQRHIQSAESHHELVHRLRNALATANVMNS